MTTTIMAGFWTPPARGMDMARNGRAAERVVEMVGTSVEPP